MLTIITIIKFYSFEKALEEENKIKNEMKKETLENLQTLMEELQRIEEANELLR